MTRLLGAFLALCALFLTPSIASADSTTAAPPTVWPGSPVPFTCEAATAETVCAPKYIVNGNYSDLSIVITNHAAGGGRCRLYINGRGYTAWVYINAADNRPHKMADNVPEDVGFNVRCQRRSASGDAGIGGKVFASAP